MTTRNRRAEVRRVKRYLTQTMNQLFAGKKPSVEQAEATLRNILRTYPLPASIGVRLNQVYAANGQVTLVVDVFDPGLEQANAALRRLTGASPERVLTTFRQVGKSTSVINTVKAAVGIKDE